MVVAGGPLGSAEAWAEETPEVPEEALVAAASVFREGLGTDADFLVVLGSGLGRSVRGFSEVSSLPFGELPGLPRAGVEGHAGRMAVGRLDGRPGLVQEGRLHLYEGHSPQTVTATIRLAGHAGVRTVLLSNASGAIRRVLEPGQILLLTDHLDLTGRPLPGTLPGGRAPADLTRRPLANPSGPDSSEGPGTRRGRPRPGRALVYDPHLARLAMGQARDMRLHLVPGTYAAVLGPSYETPAEVQLLARAGADVVGMSTVPEALAARALGMRVLAFSVVANRAAGSGERAPDHQDILWAGERAGRALWELIRRVIRRLPV